MPNPWFQVSDEPSTGDPGTTGLAAPGTSTSQGPGTTGTTGDPGDPGETSLPASSSGEVIGTTDTGNLETGDLETTSAAPGPDMGDGICHGICGEPACGECPDESQVPFAGFAIDPREVNNAQYQKFLDLDHDLAEQPPGCAWNDSYAPVAWVGDGSMPVVNIDWCDARAYCHWAGRRLCGAISGGATTVPEAFMPALDQWHHACTKGGTRPFPYGPSYDPKACNVHDYDPNVDAVMPTGSLPSCEAPVSGLFDLSGNVWELTATCTGDGPDDKCLRRGGSYFSKADDLGCYIQSVRPRKDVYAYVGFRCCSL